MKQHPKKKTICPSPNQSKNKSSNKRCFSPLTLFTHNLLEDVSPISRTSRNSEKKEGMQTFTPPLNNQSIQSNMTYLQYQTQEGSPYNMKPNYSSFQSKLPQQPIYNPYNYKTSKQQTKKVSTPHKKPNNENKKNFANVQQQASSKQKKDKKEIILTKIDINQFHQLLTKKADKEDNDLYFKGRKKAEVNTDTCYIHSAKKAKYYFLTKDQKTKLTCSQCAIQEAYLQKTIFCLLSKQQITEDPKVKDHQFDQKQSIISQQDWCISQQIDQMSKHKSQDKIEEIKKFLAATYETYQKAKRLEDNFKSQNFVSQIKEELNNINCKFLESVYSQQENTLQNEELKILLEELTFMRKDIIGNIKNIVENMQLGPFVGILQKYYQKLVQSDQKVLENEKLLSGKQERIMRSLKQGKGQLMKVLESLVNENTNSDKLMYISFENKDSFLKNQIDSKTLSITSSETQQFLDFLQQKKSDPELECKFQQPENNVEQQQKFFRLETDYQERFSSSREKTLLLSPNFNENN